jgi:DMSO/TMAO reductase YedYZ molybdopterin-dependent catalytic subunit
LFSSIYRNDRLVKTYSKSEAAKNVRPNGDVGMSDKLDAAAWRLQVVRAAGDTLRLSLADLEALPKTEVVFNFKCIEGWSQVTWWGGVRFSDFLQRYGLSNKSALQYAGLVTPDQEYYVGIDMASMLHPQTILCYEVNGKPLPVVDGAPLRLIIPVKYGIKHLKRIGLIYFDNSKPRDYWAERGYDYYAGL